MRRVTLPPSKSLAIRAAFVRAWGGGDPGNVSGDAPDDVLAAHRALGQLRRGEPADCGASAAVFRFLLVLASRLPGVHRVTGTPELLARPHSDTFQVLSTLGAIFELGPEGVSLESEGWTPPPRGNRLHVPSGSTSQTASGVVLASWGLDEGLEIVLEGDVVSSGYLHATLAVVRTAGMSVDHVVPDAGPERLRVRPGAVPEVSDLPEERCASSAFAAACVALAGGEDTLIEGCPFRGSSLQPDAGFVELLEQTGASLRWIYDAGALSGEMCLGVARPPWPLDGVRANLGQTPDLFPCLAALCGLATGESVLDGAPHLRGKESDRVAGVCELLGMMGRMVEVLPGGVRIRAGRRTPPGGDFDPRGDHRLAMAGAVAAAGGVPVRVLRPEVVRKSWPGFWSCVPERR